MHDDTDLAIRATSAGYQNGVFALRFYSDVSWGGTRTKPHPELHELHERNMNIIRQTHGPALKRIAEGVQLTDVIEFPHICSPLRDRHATDCHDEAAERLAAYTDAPLTSKIRARLGKVFASLPLRGRSVK